MRRRRRAAVVANHPTISPPGSRWRRWPPLHCGRAVAARLTVPRPARAPTPAELDRAEPGRGRRAGWPLGIPPLGWKDILWRTYREMGRDRLPALAGGVTFYMLLATFPAIAAFVSLYGLFSDVGTVERQLIHLSAHPAGRRGDADRQPDDPHRRASATPPWAPPSSSRRCSRCGAPTPA